MRDARGIVTNQHAPSPQSATVAKGFGWQMRPSLSAKCELSKVSKVPEEPSLLDW